MRNSLPRLREAVAREAMEHGVIVRASEVRMYSSESGRRLWGWLLIRAWYLQVSPFHIPAG